MTVRVIEIGVVEDVEKLCPKLKIPALVYSKFLVD
jgi:hypothetical protein